MRFERRIVLATTFAAVIAAGPAAAQESRSYVGAGFGSANFKVSSIEPRYVNDFDPGRLTSVTGEAGFSVGKRLEVSAEVWLPLKRRTITQEYGYIMDKPYRRISNYRERAFLCLVHGRLNDNGRVTAMWAAGGGLFYQNALEVFAHLVPGSLTVFGPFGTVPTSTSATRVGFTGGAEISIDAAKHLSVVPQFRMLYVPRGNTVYDAADPFGTLGINQVATRIGVSVRALF